MQRLQSTRAIGALTLLTTLAVAIASIAVLWDLRNRELEHARVETVSLTEMLVNQTEQSFNNTDLVLRSVQEKLDNAYGRQLPLDSVAVHLLLSSRVAGMDQVRSLFIVDSNGMIVNSTREYPMPRLSLADRDYFLAFARDHHDGLFVGKPVQGRSDGAWTIHVARRLDGPDRKMRGVVAMSLNLAFFENLYEFTRLDFSRPISLYRDDGTLIASLPHRAEDIGRPAPELSDIDLAYLDSKIHLLSRTHQARQEQFSLTRIEGLPLLVSVANDEREALTPWRETAMPIGLGAGVVILIIGIAAYAMVAELRRENRLAFALRVSEERYIQTIETTNQQLRNLSARLEQVREDERSRLSRELHDDLGQQLTGLKLDLAWLGGRIREARPIAEERVSEMRSLLDNLIASVRRISSDLRPPILDDQSFADALGWLKTETEKRSGLAIRLDIPAAALVTTQALATALYRIVQEALTNIIRHAEATEVVIRLTAENGQLRLFIHDNGKGLPDINNPKSGVGLVSMRERVTALGGEFSIIGAPNTGVFIEATLPLTPPDIGQNDS